MRYSNPTKIDKGKWLVDYYELLPCKCGEEHKTIIIKQEEKPTEDEIKSAIEGIRVEVGVENLLNDGGEE